MFPKKYIIFEEQVITYSSEAYIHELSMRQTCVARSEKRKTKLRKEKKFADYE